MEISVVSRKLLYTCILLSIGLLIVFNVTLPFHQSALYICNEKTGMEVYLRHNSEDSVIHPKEIKSLLHCIGRGMPFYDRTIEHVIGKSKKTIEDELAQRYVINPKSYELTGDIQHYACLHGSKRILIFEKNIVIGDLINAIKECEPHSIIVNNDYRDNAQIKALVSQGYHISFIPVGSYQKILF